MDSTILSDERLTSTALFNNFSNSLMTELILRRDNHHANVANAPLELDFEMIIGRRRDPKAISFSQHKTSLRNREL